MELMWHNVSDKFDSVNGLKLKLMDSFSEYVPSSPTFQIGYLEGRGNQKRWIVKQEDLRVMYESFNPGDDIKLWCESKTKEEGHGKRGSENKEEEPKSKREKNEDVEKEIRVQLEEKHGDKYSGPAYTLWAKFIRNGRHKSYDEPPPIPLITGEQRGRVQSKKESFSDALKGAAAVFADAIYMKSPGPSSPAPSTSTPITVSALSPNNQANLRRKYLEDLRTLSQLLNDGVLSDAEFQEQKDVLLNGLRRLK